MTEPQVPDFRPPSAHALRCCFCDREIATGPRESSSDDPHRLTFVDLAPGPVAGAAGAREQTFYCHYDCFSMRLQDPSALRAFTPEPDAITEEVIRAECGDLTADLLTETANLPFRDRLFASPPGRWIPVTDLAVGLESVRSRLSAIAVRSSKGGILLVQHTPDPLDADGPYSLIVFTLPHYLWTTAVRHRRGF